MKSAKKSSPLDTQRARGSTAAKARSVTSSRRLNLISTISPPDLYSLSRVRSVDLSRNFIKEWPKSGSANGNSSSVIERL
ncbi:hypothetical protein OESDEN_13171 [Oesophagostomum dentatum]|uniref:Leucine Rich repeat-containing domain protein n=1 Tax=Oesophagostomum dentatum TaxID=61180 RepID=A0A0B1SU76_OESDE|nr:hypothetical protein OESDEN_13171 [Oesophagostomum dentatum]